MIQTRYLILFIAILICLVGNLKAQDTLTYYSYPNLPIPRDGNPGVWDTLNFPHDIIIEDVNFYIGIETIYYVLSSELVVTITSPEGHEVTLHNHSMERLLPIWFDTEDQEDGPGDLDEYVGHNAHGDWVMHVWNYAGYYPFIWDSWAIEVIGELPVGIDEAALPLVTGINRIYPNPFNSTTIINFSLAQPGAMTIQIYDINGRLVRNLIDGNFEAGHHQIKWAGDNTAGESVASGIYFCRLSSNADRNRQTYTKKLTLLR